MTTWKRIAIALGVIVFIIIVVLGVDYLQRQFTAKENNQAIPAGSIPIYLDGDLVGAVVPADLEHLEKVSFKDAEEGKKQEGWLLRDVVQLFLAADSLRSDSQVTVSSTSRGKSVLLDWADIENADNMVVLDLANNGTLKLVSLLENLDSRDEWIQEVERIEVESP